MPKRRREPKSNFFSWPTRGIDLAILVAGALLPLAFSPLELFPLAVVSPAILFYFWQRVTPASAAWRGFLFGLGMFGVGVSWVYVSMHNFGNMPASLAAFATLLFVAILAAYPALLGFLQARFFRRNGFGHLILTLPALWTLFEWWRGWFFSGFPWLNLGYSQIDSPLAGYAPLAGVYGVGFVVALSAGLVAACFQLRRRMALALSALVVVWLVGLGLTHVDWVAPDGEPLRATLLQGNVPLRDKWDPSKRDVLLDRYRQMSFSAPVSALIVWPEAAMPGLWPRIDPAYLESLQEFSRRRGVDFLIGVIERDGRDYYNSVVSFDGTRGLYRKQHLVPFGEYIPFKPFFFWLMNNFDIPMSDLRPAPQPQSPLTVAGHKAGISVCYEDAFGEEVIRALPAAAFLVNLSEDAWFGDSLAPLQRLQMARMRALEAGRPMLRAANTGPSAAIDHHGKILVRSEQFQARLLPVQIQPMQGVTPYALSGNSIAVLTAIFALILAIFLERVKKR